MQNRIRSSKGFTLVEIMIVVVIIGLLAAMAIPAFQKVRTNSLGKTMVNDARQIAGACQQILLQYPGQATSLVITYNVTTGILTSAAAGNVPADEIQKFVTKISKGYSSTTVTYDGSVAPGAVAFSMTHKQLSPKDVSQAATASTALEGDVNFDSEGKPI
ncbi:type II secretion system protein [Nibricoccus sp. IMCC34717]|uniref:type II secretion system protein n=1 Tax=Nibricoccus sp. IMCC34717 TaxID=3034021 RepID=UPI00384E134F